MPSPARFALLCWTVLAACGGGGEGPRKQQAEPAVSVVDMHHCTISLARPSSGVYSGSGSDVDPARAKEAAWVDVCARLPAAAWPVCRDATRFTPVETSHGADGKVTHTVTLTPVVGKIAGKAEQEPDRASACKAALLRACLAAGEKGDCVASGSYVVADEVAGTTPTKVTEPQ